MALRPGLQPDEEVSIRHLCHYLAPYDKYLVAPRGSGMRHPAFRTMEFPLAFFGSVAAHNRLLLWPPFYRAFVRYEFILVHHLDSLVFSDQLARWCGAGWDYIGAPWLPCADTPWVREARVGNGGFTLMRVQSALAVLEARYRSQPLLRLGDYIVRHGRRLDWLFQALERVQRTVPSAPVRRLLEHRRKSDSPADHGYNSDFFWSYDAPRYLPGFRLAPVAEGLQFAFEASPRMCYEMNGHRLPFGCHAWTRFDRAFWEPYLLPSSRAGAPEPAAVRAS